MNQLISVIVPIYNVEPYLTRCLDSVLNQTYQNIEILLVNDGSTDNSREICSKYAEVDSRIRIVDKKNGGLGSAKNKGIDFARGNYIAVIDADDYVDKNYIEHMATIAINETADLVVCQHQKTYGSYQRKKAFFVGKETVTILDSRSAIEKLLYQRQITPSSWSKLYRKELFDCIRFPEKIYYEDLAVICQLLIAAKRIAVCNKGHYHYYIRHNSIMNQDFSEKKISRIEITKSIKTIIDNAFPDLCRATSQRCFLSALQLWRELPLQTKYRESIDQTWKIIQDYRNCVIFDRKAKTSVRLMAISSYLGKRPLKILGGIYTFVINFHL